VDTVYINLISLVTTIRWHTSATSTKLTLLVLFLVTQVTYFMTSLTTHW